MFFYERLDLLPLAVGEVTEQSCDRHKLTLSRGQTCVLAEETEDSLHMGCKYLLPGRVFHGLSQCGIALHKAFAETFQVLEGIFIALEFSDHHTESAGALQDLHGLNKIEVAELDTCVNGQVSQRIQCVQFSLAVPIVAFQDSK